MIRINLLPVRAVQRRHESKVQLQIGTVVLAVAVAGGAWLYTVQEQELAERQTTLAHLNAQLKDLDKIVKEVQKFQEQKSLLERKVEVIGGLKKNQRRPAHVPGAGGSPRICQQ